MLKPFDASDRDPEREAHPASAASQLDIRGLVANFHGDVYRYAYRLAGCVEDAEDLTQQAFLMAQQRLHQIREPAKVRGWLFAVLRSCYLKSRRRNRPVTASSIEMDVECIPENVREDSIDRQQLQLAIDDLPDRLKIVLVMFYFEQASYQEIADAQDVPIGTVMSRLSRAKGRLRQRLLQLDAKDASSPADLTLSSSGGRRR